MRYVQFFIYPSSLCSLIPDTKFTNSSDFIIIIIIIIIMKAVQLHAKEALKGGRGIALAFL